MSRYVVGVDVGSTNIKLLLADADDGCAQLHVEQRPTPWRSDHDGRTELDAERLVATLVELFRATADRLAASAGPDARVLAVSISSMGETGFLLDREGRPAAPGVAWFDPRGRFEVAALDAAFGHEFPARTGLPLGVQVTVVKLANLAGGGLDLSGLRWLNLADYVAVELGGRVCVDSSLTSRTGLIDQDSGRPWPPLLRHLGVTDDFLPPIVDAGVSRGHATAAWLPEPFRGAELCVAGHDHLVSSVGAQPLAENTYHASLGTAEVLLRVLDSPLTPQVRVRLAQHLINCVRHVEPGTWVLVAGVKTGLLQRRCLQMFGITDHAGRDALDEAVMRLPVDGSLEPGAIEVKGARNDDGVLHLTVRADGATPAELFAAVLRHGNDELALLIDVMDRELPAAHKTILTGGWSRMRSVQRARSLVLPAVTLSEREQDTASGAAVFAARLLASEITRRDRHATIP